MRDNYPCSVSHVFKLFVLCQEPPYYYWVWFSDFFVISVRVSFRYMRKNKKQK